ncbi:hypothetical protein BJ912DRAFT_1152286 [Pholiota molesta]|nr:hypothetical protein BJ912DRAFT_1152286 [Pholiota molesta]
MEAESNSSVPQNACDMLYSDWYDPSWNCIPQPPYNQELMYTILIATAAWCLVLVLAVLAFRAVSRGRSSSSSVYSPRMQRILLGYIAVMTLFSTGALVQNVIYVQNLLFSSYDIDSKSAELGALIYTAVSITLPFAVSGADGLMAWRCWVLYQGVRRPLRVSVCCILTFLIICSLASAALTLILPNGNFAPATPLLAVTTTVNLVFSALIVSRLLYHERCLQTLLGVQEKGTSPVRRVIAMCVESCALIVVFSVCALGMGWSLNDTVWNLSTVPLTLLPHICVISPFLIIIRVANGRAPATTQLPSSMECDDVEGRKWGLYSLRFSRPASILVQGVPPSLSANAADRKLLTD